MCWVAVFWSMGDDKRALITATPGILSVDELAALCAQISLLLIFSQNKFQNKTEWILFMGTVYVLKILILILVCSLIKTNEEKGRNDSTAKSSLCLAVTVTRRQDAFWLICTTSGYLNIVSPSLHYFVAFPVAGGLEASTPRTGCQWITGLTHRDRQSFTLTFTPWGSLSYQLTCMTLDCGWTPGYAQVTHPDIEQKGPSQPVSPNTGLNLIRSWIFREFILSWNYT